MTGSETGDLQRGLMTVPSLDTVVFLGPPVLEGGCLFIPATQNQNNHRETVLFKSLLGPLALASY